MDTSLFTRTLYTLRTNRLAFHLRMAEVYASGNDSPMRELHEAEFWTTVHAMEAQCQKSSTV